jgi:hypothetical protein
MLTNFFKRTDATLFTPSVQTPETPVAAPTTSAPETLTERRKVPRPLPAGEVIEGNGDTVWGLMPGCNLAWSRQTYLQTTFA